MGWNLIEMKRQLAMLVAATVLLLMIPLVAMQVSNEVNWSVLDFIVMGALLLSAGIAYVLVAGLRNDAAYKAAVGLAVSTAFVLVWINLAVGLIGSENNPANLLYLGVIATGLVGAAIARLRPRGMKYALIATAIVQAIVPFVAMIVWTPEFTAEESPGIIGVIFLNTGIALLFAISALLFRRADFASQN
ncbi:MAG: hypothetical protein H6507_12125 [Calditrichaeota bacterium]|nr:hypothetical protein [Calditrichota bacterium]